MSSQHIKNLVTKSRHYQDYDRLVLKLYSLEPRRLPRNQRIPHLKRGGFKNR